MPGCDQARLPVGELIEDFPGRRGRPTDLDELSAQQEEPLERPARRALDGVLLERLDLVADPVERREEPSTIQSPKA